jgi:hypothetical protein
MKAISAKSCIGRVSDGFHLNRYEQPWPARYPRAWFERPPGVTLSALRVLIIKQITVYKYYIALETNYTLLILCCISTHAENCKNILTSRGFLSLAYLIYIETIQPILVIRTPFKNYCRIGRYVLTGETILLTISCMSKSCWKLQNYPYMRFSLGYILRGHSWLKNKHLKALGPEACIGEIILSCMSKSGWKLQKYSNLVRFS